ncbi:hypothetical protein ABZ484_15885 [Streptomyces sp. NPDC006393]|uniref:hypothetical protein n=1 Tax=Streptomyces sp. NPDC006393 TaxID=3156763 RepID=UPI0033E32090
MARTRTGRAEQPGAGGAPRGRTRWWLVAAVAVLPAMALLPFVVAFVGLAFSDSEYPLGGGPKAVSCTQALAFGGAALPDGGTPVGGCVEQGWQDVSYSADFRMPRAGVGDRLRRTYPGAPAPETEFCTDDADLCLDLSCLKGLPMGVGADAVQVSVVYEDAGTALVRFAAFTV